jgi:ATP-dependent DNA helicase RecQ
VALGLARPDMSGHGGLSLAPAAAQVLRGMRTVHFRLDIRTGERRSSRPERKSAIAAGALDPAAKALWDELRTWRLEEARRQELPPYVIFHDSTLTEMARLRPVSLSALAGITGIGRSKLDRYGSTLIAIVSQHCGSPPAAGERMPVPKEADTEGETSS